MNALTVFLLILLLCMGALIVIRLMGNRTVGQLSPFDFIIMVGMGDIIVTTAMDQNQTIFAGSGGLLALLFLQRALSYLSLKSTMMRKLFEGLPVVLIAEGKIIQENFRRTRFNYDDLRQELHKLGMDMSQVKDIKLARLESCGVVTIVKKYDLEPVSKRDVQQAIDSLYENPLSPMGREWEKLQDMIREVHEIARLLKEQQPK